MYFHINNHASKFYALSLKNKLQKCVRKFCFSQWALENSFIRKNPWKFFWKCNTFRDLSCWIYKTYFKKFIDPSIHVIQINPLLETVPHAMICLSLLRNLFQISKWNTLSINRCPREAVSFNVGKSVLKFSYKIRLLGLFLNQTTNFVTYFRVQFFP